MSDTYYYLRLIRNSLPSPSDLFGLSVCGWTHIKVKIKRVPISLSKTNAKKKKNKKNKSILHGSYRGRSVLPQTPAAVIR